MTKPKISIIIPYKNAEEYLPRCLNSLTSKDGNFEFIFVNDESTDAGPEIIRGSDDDRVRTADNSSVGGVSAARNTGLCIAEGDWITFLDADDELLPGAYNKYLQMVKLKPDALIHQANHIRWLAKTGRKVRKYYNPDGIYEIPQLPEMWAPVWNKLYKRELLYAEGSPRFDLRLRFGEDEVFNLDCLAKAKRIHCTAVDIMQHNLENPESLSRIKQKEDLERLCRSLHESLLWHEDPKLKQVIYNTILQHYEAMWWHDIMCKA